MYLRFYSSSPLPHCAGLVWIQAISYGHEFHLLKLFGMTPQDTRMTDSNATISHWIIRWHNGAMANETMAQRHNGTVAQWRDGAMVQWYNGKIVQLVVESFCCEVAWLFVCWLLLIGCLVDGRRKGDNEVGQQWWQGQRQGKSKTTINNIGSRAQQGACLLAWLDRQGTTTSKTRTDNKDKGNHYKTA